MFAFHTGIIETKQGGRVHKSKLTRWNSAKTIKEFSNLKEVNVAVLCNCSMFSILSVSWHTPLVPLRRWVTAVNSWCGLRSKFISAAASASAYSVSAASVDSHDIKFKRLVDSRNCKWRTRRGSAKLVKTASVVRRSTAHSQRWSRRSTKAVVSRRVFWQPYGKGTKHHLKVT